MKKKKTTGQQLKTKRLERNLDLEDVYKHTKIHPRVLLALEEDRADKNLNQFYIKNFLRDYAVFLGLDAETLIKEYSASHKFTSSAAITDTIKNLNLPAFIRNLNLRTAVIAVLSISCFIIYLSLANNKSTSSDTLKKKLPNKQSVLSSSLEEKKEFPQIQKKEPLLLSLRTKKEVWMQVKADKKIIFQDTLKKDSVREWTADDSIELWVGDGGALELELNGQYLGSPGAGVIKNIIITKEGMAIGNKK